MNQRTLSSIRQIDAILPHPNADAIELAIIGGWQVVVKKGEFQPNDLVVFFEIDSWIPTDLAPFLTRSGAEPKVYNGVAGERLRTVKLRGELSQGLVLPLSTIYPLYPGIGKSVISWDEIDLINSELDSRLGIQKWEAPISPQLAGTARGSFPHWIRKTDVERAQNLKKELFGSKADPNRRYEVTIKIDGSSTTFALKDGQYYVCSRNINLKTENDENAFVKMGQQLQMESRLMAIGRNLAVQGELFGPRICGNNEKLDKVHFAVFSVWDIDAQRYLTPSERQAVMEQLGPEVEHVPVLYYNVTFSDLGIHSMNDLLNFATGPSRNPAVSREGVVFKSESDGGFAFKAISNEWLLKNKN